MLHDLPFYIPLLFIFITVVTLIFLLALIHRSNLKNRLPIIRAIILIWLVIHAVLAYKNFYLVTNSMPPRFALLVAPPFLFILVLFITRGGRKFIDSLSLKILTQLHVVRIFVEIILYWLFLYRYIPQLMTFEGRNFDIISGLSAPFIAYFGFSKKTLSRSFLIFWNLFCLALLINIVVNAILSAPFPFQQFGFDQPNIAVLYFPFVWLPCFIVPVVLFAHLASIRLLIKRDH